MEEGLARHMHLWESSFSGEIGEGKSGVEEEK